MFADDRVVVVVVRTQACDTPRGLRSGPAEPGLDAHLVLKWILLLVCIGSSLLCLGLMLGFADEAVLADLGIGTWQWGAALLALLGLCRWTRPDNLRHKKFE